MLETFLNVTNIIQTTWPQKHVPRILVSLTLIDLSPIHSSKYFLEDLEEIDIGKPLGYFFFIQTFPEFTYLVCYHYSSIGGENAKFGTI